MAVLPGILRLLDSDRGRHYPDRAGTAGLNTEFTVLDRDLHQRDDIGLCTTNFARCASHSPQLAVGPGAWDPDQLEDYVSLRDTLAHSCALCELGDLIVRVVGNAWFA